MPIRAILAGQGPAATFLWEKDVAKDFEGTEQRYVLTLSAPSCPFVAKQ